MALGMLAMAAVVAMTGDPVAGGFRNPPPEARMRMYWRLFGPAWTKPEIDYQLGLIKDAHVGGVTLYPMYPVALDDASAGVHNQRFLSPEYLQTLGYAARKAKELGLRFSINGGTGWPYGGPSVSIHDAAQRIRQENAPFPALKEDEKVVAGADGRVFISGPTGMRVKRPAFGAEGPVLDHYDTGALERYLATVIEPQLKAAPGIESVFCDSLEVYNANWTHDFPPLFRQIRGYDLIPHLPALFDGDPDVRFDFWRTLTEVMEERFTKPLGDWSHAHGCKLEMEAYGTPPNPQTAAKYIDIPTGEHYEWKGYSVSRYVASSAHVTGRRIVGAEAWTWAGLPNRLADSLSDLKLVSDMHFLGGVNDITGVDFAYSPRAAGSPGWLPYYGPAFNQNNPQWAYFSAFADYVNRCQWMLRQGKPVADVAVYLPVEDCLAHGPVEMMLLDFHLRDSFVTGEPTSEFGLKNALTHHSNLIHNLITHGFDFDGLDFWAIDRLARVKNGRLIAGDGSYSTVILHNIEGIDPKALEKIAQFTREGGTVIFVKRLPVRAYGVNGKRDSQRVKELVDDILSHRALFVPDDGEAFVDVLGKLKPDVTMTPYQPTVGFVHRRDGKRDIYFLVNVADKPTTFTATYRDAHGPATFWDPMDGSIRSSSVSPRSEEGEGVRIALPARGSLFVCFGFDVEAEAPRREVHAVLRYPGSWHVTFEGPDAPAPRDTKELVSWTAWPDAKYFSGKATYTTSWWQGGKEACRIRLPEVHEVAEVKVNGRVAGVVFNPPWEVDITDFLKVGDNEIQITVASLPVNRFLGQPDVDLGPLRAVYGNRFPAPEEKQIMKEPAPSGLIGPVEFWYGGAP